MSAMGDNSLPALAQSIVSAIEAHRAIAIASAEQAIEAGRLLIEAKALVPHGQWQLWLRDKTNLSERSARRYMQLYRSGIKSATVADLGLRRTMEELAGRTTARSDDSDVFIYLPRYCLARQALRDAADGIGRGSIEDDLRLFYAAKTAVDAADLDEVEAVPDQQMRMHLYAFQANDTVPVKSAVEIRLRMERRVAQMRNTLRILRRIWRCARSA